MSDAPQRSAITQRFHTVQPARSVRFGAGVVSEIGQVLDELGRSRAFVFATPSQQATVGRVGDLLGPQVVGASSTLRARVPADLAAAAAEQAQAANADAVIALGGGSAIGIAKAVAAATGLPIIAVPTTYSGSEMTPIYGVTRAGVKTPHHDLRVAPRAVLYDPELTVSLSPALTATSGMNALAQAVGSLYAADADPVSTLVAGDGIQRMVSSLPRCFAEPHDLHARSEALLGAHLCGWALAMAGLSAHHALTYALGDHTGLAQASIHAVLLPQTTHWAAARRDDVAAVLCRVLSTDDPAGRIYDVPAGVDLPRGLGGLGLTRAAFEKARAAILRDPPAPWRSARDDNALEDLLNRTYDGLRPPAPADRACATANQPHGDDKGAIRHDT
ncbi:MAG TPA: iron-containing alcohol dehydrogenase [Pseudonocardia sp.]